MKIPIVDEKDIVFDKVEVVNVKWFSKEELVDLVNKNPDDYLATLKEFVDGKVEF